MAKDDMPFDDDMMTLIMGIEPDGPNPGKPGQHGPKETPMPEDDVIDTLIKIRNLCEDAINKAGKGEPTNEKEPKEDEEDEF